MNTYGINKRQNICQKQASAILYASVKAKKNNTGWLKKKTWTFLDAFFLQVPYIFKYISKH